MEHNIYNIECNIKDSGLTKEGKQRIEWASRGMPVLQLIRERFSREKPLQGVRIGACLHVTAETANLVRTLQAGGAEVALCASNPLSTQDDVAAALVVESKIPVFAIRGESDQMYYEHIRQVLRKRPQITMDDGADLVTALQKLKIKNEKSKIIIRNAKLGKWEFYGSSEETTTGVIRLKAMEKDGALKIPVVAVNDSYTKYLFDNRYGTGQSAIDGILRATNILLAGKKFVVIGYGWCGRGIAMRAKGLGAEVIVCEVNPVRALEAKMDGFQVERLQSAVKKGAEIVVAATGNKQVIDKQHFLRMRDGVLLANSGHFNVEINLVALEEIALEKKQIKEHVTEYKIKSEVKSEKRQESKVKRIYVLGKGRLINLVAAEGHPAEVMDMSFANQALAAEWFVRQRGKLQPQVYKLPERLDNRVAKLKLAAMRIKIDRLTREQKRYLSSWEEGT